MWRLTLKPFLSFRRRESSTTRRCEWFSVLRCRRCRDEFELNGRKNRQQAVNSNFSNIWCNLQLGLSFLWQKVSNVPRFERIILTVQVFGGGLQQFNFLFVSFPCRSDQTIQSNQSDLTMWLLSFTQLTCPPVCPSVCLSVLSHCRFD